MFTRRQFSTRVAATVGLAATARLAAAQSASAPTTAMPAPGMRNVVLVHGAYADGSCWSDVIALLQRAGLRATAVQNPLTSLADDVAATQRILALQDGPTLLVGHSWAGTVISEAGVDPKVVGLVYVAARAPGAGEDYGALAAKFPTPPASAGLVKSGGFAQLSEEAFLRDFAGDVPTEKARVLYALQGRIAETLFASRTTVAAWRSKPSWYAVSTQDRTTSPELQRFVAARMKAKTIEVASSHVSLISHPREIAGVILEAAMHTTGTG
ncbi:alpha/beta hydrolase [Rhizobacter sp. OV335]|uniref:alpha/beta hydrolase n=1 Tax=Rhizobacter sp. OV335 TaxID=1500264 RepID=UPI000937924A|nr:alpha/beta hydrolase [Rhizobacter sp. OV335]